jgi:pimeloyl-ACP methyl ester carboxylesterase
MKHLGFRKKKIFYTDEGKGKAIVLLHGFMESSAIWKDVSRVLKNAFRVITVDLPGHGKSECLSEVHDMDLMAICVHKVLKELKVPKCVMIGHSMGGYVALAFADRYPEMIKGFALFHSHIFEDTPEAKLNRDRTIAIVKRNKPKFTTQFISELFPPETRVRFQEEISKLIDRAGEMNKEGVIAALEGLKIRPDRTEMLKNIKVPVLFILGMKDPKVPSDRCWEMVSLPRTAEILLLRDVGHMGFIEAPLETIRAIYAFSRNLL